MEPAAGLRGRHELRGRGAPLHALALERAPRHPLLDEAEGLRPEAMPAYNAIIWTWGLSAAGALVRETRRRDLAAALLGVATAFALRPSARHHFVWVREQARVRPAWWNRALVQRSEAAPPVP